MQCVPISIPQILCCGICKYFDIDIGGFARRAIVRKVIVTVALTGGQHGKEVNPNLPEQPDEIAEDAYRCWQGGAAIAHIHARDKSGKAASDADIYREIKKQVRKKGCEIIVAFTTGGGPHLRNEERMQSIYAEPEICSLNMGTLVRPGWKENNVFLNPPELLEEWSGLAKQMGIKPELEIYNHSMFVDVQNLIEKGLIEKPYFINLVLGMKRQGSLPADIKPLVSMIDFVPKDSIFNVTIVGRMQFALTTAGIAMGGNIRIGLEDNVFYFKGVLATNEQLVARAVRLIKEMGFEVASADEARKMLGLPPPKMN
jgi:3-keto-5-aminohexanoate cleavage enzyme